MTDRRFAKDVARELDRRRRNRRLVFLLLWAALIALAVAYVRCGGSWGLGGKGAGSGGGGSGVTVGSNAHLDRCEIRVTGAGISVDGVVRKRDDVVTICSKRHGADVVITGDAREGDWKDLKAALEAAKIDIYVHNATP